MSSFDGANIGEDPFDALGVPATMALTQEQIATAYLRRVALVHPDMGGDEGDEGAGDDAGAGAARLNAAKAVLMDIEGRAGALVARSVHAARAKFGAAGVPEAERGSAALPPGFLMEIMEVREAVDAAWEVARDGRDGAARSGADHPEVARWREWGLGERARYAAEVGAAVERARAAGSAEESRRALMDARTTLNAWRYVERLLEQLDPAYEGRASAPGDGAAWA
jgi:curved DNA-binding protein CbpA